MMSTTLQRADTGTVLMTAFMSGEAWRRTLDTGLVTLFRPTLGRVWVKGEDDRHYVEATVIVKARPDSNLCGHGYPARFIHKATPASG